MGNAEPEINRRVIRINKTFFIALRVEFADMPRQKGYTHKYPYLGTMGRIRALAAYREQYLKEMGQPPVWTTACNRVGINLRTVLRHAPGLAAKWYNTEYHL